MKKITVSRITAWSSLLSGITTSILQATGHIPAAVVFLVITFTCSAVCCTILAITEGWIQ
jgi:hypothetical protein